MSEKSKNLSTNGTLSSMDSVRISESIDGSVTLTILDDKSHGYRTFVFDEKDWEALTKLIAI